MSPYSPQPNMIYYVNENQFVMKSQQCGRSTEWKFLDHSTTQILREIKFGNFGASKTTKFDLFCQNLEMFGILKTFQNKIFSKIKIQSL